MFHEPTQTKPKRQDYVDIDILEGRGRQERAAPALQNDPYELDAILTELARGNKISVMAKRTGTQHG